MLTSSADFYSSGLSNCLTGLIVSSALMESIFNEQPIEILATGLLSHEFITSNFP